MSLAPIHEKLKTLPELPGVYLYKNLQGDILYIGKAKVLRQRVRSYFQPSANHTLRIQIMVSLVHDVSLVITDTEAEALILEEQLIKTHRPRYNVLLKDDKSYPFCKLTTQEPYPRLRLVREKQDKQSEYFGPFPSVQDARQMLRVVNRYFPLRTSKMDLDGKKTYRPCLNFQMKRCLAPCRGDVPVDTYQEVVRQVRLFLKGRDDELLKDLERLMKEAAARLDFEKAAQIRDQIQAVRRVFAKQAVLSTNGEDQDVFNLYREADSAGIQVLFIRNGRLLGTDFFFYDASEQASDDNLLGQVLNRIYMAEAAQIPREVLLPFAYSDQESLEQALSERADRKVQVLVPQKGRKRELVAMAHQNAKVHLEEQRQRTVQDDAVLEQVQRHLLLKKPPATVEAFDISHLSGTMTVASMVAWKDNRPFKAGYRKFKIKSLEGPDDFASMEEVLTRRYQRLLEQGERPPDLILIDGGKGQVSAAAEALRRLGMDLNQVDLIGLAKGRSEQRRKYRRGNNEDFEYVVKPNQKNEIRLHRNTAVLFFLQNIRDESHRFAIEFQRQLKRKDNLKSLLDEIPGVGPSRKKALLKHFGSLKALRQASLAELEAAPGVSASLAATIFEFFQEAQRQLQQKMEENRTPS